MRKSFIRLFFIFSALAATAASFQVNATPSQGVSDFVFHPTHCQAFLGSDAHSGDSVSVEYAEALSSALDSQPGDVAAVLTTIDQHCRADMNSPESISSARAKGFAL